MRRLMPHLASRILRHSALRIADGRTDRTGAAASPGAESRPLSP